MVVSLPVSFPGGKTASGERLGVVDAVAALVEFTHEQSALQLPPGNYVGTEQPAPYLLGANGMERHWRKVRIISGPETAASFVGELINIW